MELELRRAGAEDTDAIVNLLVETYRATWLPQLNEAARERVDRENAIGAYVRRHHEAMYVALIGGHLAGAAHWDGGGVLHALHVRPHLQRRGIGSALLGAAENSIARNGGTVLRAETDTFNEQSRRFYRKHGYQEIDQYPDTEWQSGLTTVLLEKTLPMANGPDT